MKNHLGPGTAPAEGDVSVTIAPAVGTQFEAVSLENRHLRATFIPHLGGKLTSLRRVSSGREFLLQPQRPLRSYAGGSFEDYDTSGFDECFPTVAACEYPNGHFARTELPDHGELWNMPWRYTVRGEELCMATATHKLPCEFRKRVRLEGDSLILKYEVESFTDVRFHYVWSSHPLLAVSEGDRILLPPGADEMLINWSSDSYLGKFGERCSWPVAHLRDGRTEDLSRMSPSSARKAAKLFTERVALGCAALYHAETDESISFHFDPQLVPYVGVWICEGGWPSATDGHHTVAIEPCRGRPDSLAEAIARRDCPEMLPGKVERWELRLRLQDGTPDELAERLKR